MNALNNMKIGTKLVGSFVFMAILLVGVAVLGYLNMKTINDNMTTMYTDRLLPIDQLGGAETAMYKMRGDDFKYILIESERATTEAEIQQDITEVEKQLTLYKASNLTNEEKTALSELEKNWALYKVQVADDVAQVKRGEIQAAITDSLQGGATYNVRIALDATMTELIRINVDVADKLNADSDVIFSNSQNVLLVVGIIAVLVSIGLGVILSNSITGPLQKGVYMMQEMSLGHLGNRLNMDRKDEIGVLARDMDLFAANLQNIVVGTLKKIAEGDLSSDVTKKDERDEIAPALIQITTALRGLVAEALMLTRAGVDGKLSTRGDASKFKGGYHEIVQGVNNTLDAVIGPLNVAATYVERISRGDIPAKITDSYNGDFNIIKNNLNVCIDAVNTLVADANMLSRAGVEGRLATRADASRHQGDFRRIVQGVDDTLDAVIGPLNVAANYVDKIAGGVVPAPITDNYNGDFNILKNNLNRMSNRLREMLTSISDAANSLSSATAEILAATTQQASGASEQSAAISQTTTTVEEVKASTEQASMRAQDVATASQKTVEVARTGTTSVQATIESMGVIKEKVESISENLLALSDQTQQIGEIISQVNEIASQSNMLALNASVEAARAGEHGKGFAVVATEVRSLAEQSRQATDQIKAILSEIQKATNSTVMATEEGVKGVERGVGLSAQSREAIEQLSAVINESAQVSAQVYASGQQQQTGIDQISMAMNNINQVTMQNLASTRQTEKAAQNLTELARKMTEILSQYKFN